MAEGQQMFSGHAGTCRVIGTDEVRARTRQQMVHRHQGDVALAERTAHTLKGALDCETAPAEVRSN